jgi:hypothetical protein
MLKICFICNDWEGKLVEAYDGYAHPKCLKRIDRRTLKGQGWTATPSYHEKIGHIYRENRAIEDALESLSSGTDFILDDIYKELALNSPTLKVYYALKQFNAPIEPDILFQIVQSEMDSNTMNKSLRHLTKLGYAKETKGYWYNIKW